ASLNPEEHQDRMIMATEKLIAQIYKNIREFDILGQLDDDVFCIMIIGIGLEKTQLWAEKLRNEYAMTLMEIDGKKFNATLSMGLANGIRTNTVEELVENCAKALNISLEKTNHVQIYS
ncbi:MAG: diguanylate cyclase domain-containing protein, partial [Candidatus Kapaibacteriota bacterium]